MSIFRIQIKLVLIIMFCSLGFITCGYENSAEGVAEEFLYRYFIELNQKGALELSTGLAKDKLREEIELVQGIRSNPELDLSQAKPFIDYKMVNSHRRSDKSIAFFYDVSIKSKGGEKNERQVVLNMVKIAGKWKVKNFDTFTADKPE
ncbi:MAG: hypothetical protein ACE5JB_15335 [bacterium]